MKDIQTCMIYKERTARIAIEIHGHLVYVDGQTETNVYTW